MKTRLISDYLTEHDVLHLYTAFLQDTITQAHLSNLPSIILSLHGVEENQRKNMSTLDFLSSNECPTDKIWDSFHFQQKDNFGINMKDAILWSFNQGFEKLIILGADTPHINPHIINSAHDLLSEYSVVLGPSSAGGIYLIGLTNDLNLVGLEQIFTGIELSNFALFTSKQDLSFTLIEELSDIDQEEDLIGLIAWLDALSEITKNPLKTLQQHFIPSNTLRTIKELNLRVVTDRDNNRNKRIIIDS